MQLSGPIIYNETKTPEIRSFKRGNIGTAVRPDF